MKKIFFLMLFVASNLILAQNIVFEQVALKVKPGSAGQVLDLVDGFYSEIDKPEGVYITLYAINFKADDIPATHFLTFSGSVEGLAKLRELRSGDKYLLYNSSMLRHSEITSISAGATIMRMNVDKARQPIAQIWRWRVEDPAAFGNEFTDLIKSFPQLGYLSLGQFTHGTSSKGESHYVFTTHENFGAALSWGPKTQSQQQAFLKFQKTTSKYSNFLGSATMSNIKTW